MDLKRLKFTSLGLLFAIVLSESGSISSGLMRDSQFHLKTGTFYDIQETTPSTMAYDIRSGTLGISKLALSKTQQ